MGAHRVAWLVCRGPIPVNAFVLHRCDNRACVRPDHLFLGSAADNTHDMFAKGRARRRTVRTPELDAQVRLRAAAGESHNAIATGLDIGRATVYRILKGEP